MNSAKEAHHHQRSLLGSPELKPHPPPFIWQAEGTDLSSPRRSISLSLSLIIAALPRESFLPNTFENNGHPETCPQRTFQILLQQFNTVTRHSSVHTLATGRCGTRGVYGFSRPTKIILIPETLSVGRDVIEYRDNLDTERVKRNAMPRPSSFMHRQLVNVNLTG